MTVKEMTKYIGKQGLYPKDGDQVERLAESQKRDDGKPVMRFRVIIKDCRVMFARNELLITPMDGEGECWRRFDRVQIIEEDGK